jgi:hypothetical protein
LTNLSIEAPRIARTAFLVAAAALVALPAAAQTPQRPPLGLPAPPACLDERCLNLPPAADAGKPALILAPSALPEESPTPSGWRLIGSVRHNGAVELKRSLLSW